MSDIIRIKIDVTKIDKARLFKGKAGAVYLDAMLLPGKNGPDQYGNTYMIVQDVSKEERLAGTKGAILGNAKPLSAGHARPVANQTALPKKTAAPEDTDDVPF